MTNSMLVQDRIATRFQSLFEEDLVRELASVGELKKVSVDDFLMTVGRAITHIPLVLSGALKVMTEDENGDELLLYYLELGDTCAMTLNCCTKKSKSAVTAIAEEETEVLLVPVEKMEEWMVKYSSWRAFVLGSYNSRLNEMLEAIDGLAFNNMNERLIKYLRDRAMVMHSGNLNITHHQIANDLNSSRVVISRLMKKLEMDGLIEQYRNKVKVLEFMPK